MLCVSCMCICMIWTNYRKVKANTVGIALQHWLWIWGTSDRRRRHYFPSPHRTRWPCSAAQPAPTTLPTIYYAAKHSTVWTIYYMYYARCSMQYAHLAQTHMPITPLSNYALYNCKKYYDVCSLPTVCNNPATSWASGIATLGQLRRSRAAWEFLGSLKTAVGLALFLNIDQQLVIESVPPSWECLI